MTRRFLIAKGVVGPAFESHEERAHARYLRERRIPHTEFVLTDFGRYPTKGSDGMRAAADAALLVELEASLELPK